MAIQSEKSIFIINGIEVESWNESRAILDYAVQELKWPRNSVFFSDRTDVTEIYSSRTNETVIIGPVINKKERERMMKEQSWLFE